MLQRIETSTGSGVPDCYFSCQHIIRCRDVPEENEYSNYSCWLETKTQEYKVTPEQVNWSHSHELTGGESFVVTEVNKEIVVLDFDDRMTDCSSLGVYIRRYKPLLLEVKDWLAMVQLDAAIVKLRS